MHKESYRGGRAQGRPPRGGEDTGIQFCQHHDGRIGSGRISIDDRRSRRNSRSEEPDSYEEVTSEWRFYSYMLFIFFFVSLSFSVFLSLSLSLSMKIISLLFILDTSMPLNFVWNIEYKTKQKVKKKKKKKKKQQKKMK